MIYFVRHGQTNWNLAKKLQGLADIPLNENGIKQAEETREKLKDIKFDVVFCSPLQRAKKTCEIITNQNKDIFFDDRIVERDFGDYQGLTKDECDLDLLWKSDNCQELKNAETLSEMEERVYEFLDEVIAQYPTENILIVSHGGVGVIVSSYYLGKPKDGNYMKYLSDNGQVLTFENTKNIDNIKTENEKKIIK